MGFYIGQRKEHGNGKFSFWMTDLSLETFFSLGKALVIFLGILAIISAVLSDWLIYFGIAGLVVSFLIKRLKK